MKHGATVNVSDLWKFTPLHEAAAKAGGRTSLSDYCNQRSVSMTFWCGSGSADPCLLLVDPDPDSDPDPSFFVIDLQDANKKLIFNKNFLLITVLFEGTFT